MRQNTFLRSFYSYPDEEREWTLAKAQREAAEEKKKKSAQEKKAAVAADLFQRTRREIIRLFRYFLLRNVPRVNLMAPTCKLSGKPRFDVVFAQAFSGIKHGNGATKAIAEVLCWLRQNGHIGIVGFSGNNSQKLKQFIAKAKRLDVHIFSSFEPFAREHLEA